MMINLKNINIQNAGTIVAIVISIFALLHSMWAEQKSLECDYLYSKHDSLFNLEQTIERLSASYNRTFSEAQELYFADPEFANTTGDELQKLTATLISKRIQLVDLLEDELESSQYVIDDNDLNEIKEKIGALKEKSRIFLGKSSKGEFEEEDLFNLFVLASEVVESMNAASESALRETAKELRIACGNQQ